MGIELDGIVEILPPAKPEATPESRPHFARRLATPVALTLASLSFLMSATLVVGQRKRDQEFHKNSAPLIERIDDLSDDDVHALTRFCIEELRARQNTDHIESLKEFIK